MALKRIRNNTEQTAAAPINTNCSARGCPLAGSISRSIGADPATKWWCRFHDGLEYEDLDAMTTKVRPWIWLHSLIFMSYKAKKISDGIANINATLNHHGVSGIFPAENETPWGWADRAGRWVEKQIRFGSEKMADAA